MLKGTYLALFGPDNLCRNLVIAVITIISRCVASYWNAAPEVTRNALVACARDIGDALGWPVIWRICAQTAWRPQAWCNDLAVGGGAFLEGGVHMLTTARVLFGEASGWQGSVRHFSGGTAPDSGTIMVDYEGGHQCVLSLYWGTEGCFDGTCDPVSAPATLVTPRLTRGWWPADNHGAMWTHLLKCIAGEAEPVATLAHAAGAVADVWRCYEAAGVTR